MSASCPPQPSMPVRPFSHNYSSCSCCKPLVPLDPGEVDGGRGGSSAQGGEEEIRVAAEDEHAEAPAEAEEVLRHHAQPPTVSPEERANHYRTGHAQFRSWCEHCVRIRARSDRHPHHRPGGDQPEVAFDYAYLGSQSVEDDEAAAAEG